MTEAEPKSIRLDKWLWQARFFKTRTLAAAVVSSGAARVNSTRVTKPATPVRPGDGISFAQGERVRAVRVLALGVRRGPAPEARLLYHDLDEPQIEGAATLDPDRHAVK
ncbi:MAG: RNA-binding protein [Rhodovulum sulfidophilum]|uniref:RNA-binding protein n=1 Tax=Rhodovulum sulfidophilum TaxID=35806 RepID=A0A2W5NFH3_RHOSU|nr:MAG: RNA-binding protein [Rhodovulum sulfidophilum]